MLLNLAFYDESKQVYFGSVFVGAFLGLVCFFIFIFFLRFIIKSIQVETILSLLKDEFNSSIARVYAPIDDACYINDLISEHAEQSEYTHKYLLQSKCHGYLKVLDYESLLKTADDNNLRLYIQVCPGSLILKNTLLVNLYSIKKLEPSELQKLTSSIESSFTVEKNRSSIQDLTYAIEKIDEIALKALSPGIHSPYTAILCIDNLAECLFLLNEKKPLAKILCNSKKEIRIIRVAPGHDLIVKKAFDNIRQVSKDMLFIQLKLLDIIGRLLSASASDDMKIALIQQANMIEYAFNQSDHHPQEQHDFEQAYNFIKEHNLN